MEMDVRRNPALLKLDLYCKGMQLDESCHVADDGGRTLLRTRAGLGSGLELILAGPPGGPDELGAQDGAAEAGGEAPG